MISYKTNVQLEHQNQHSNDTSTAQEATACSCVSMYTCCTSLTGEAAVAVRIRAYGASGHLALEESNVLQGTRLLLTCDVKELPEGYVVVSYKWYHSCSTGRCEIRRESSYYTPVNDTLIVDATSWSRGKRRHTCDVEYRSVQGSSRNLTGFIAHVSLTA